MTLTVLADVRRLEPVRPSDLAEQMHLDLSTVSRHVTGLVDRGLLERAADPDDARAQLVRLTPAGDDVFTTIVESRAASIGDAVRHWSTNDRRTAHRAARAPRARPCRGPHHHPHEAIPRTDQPGAAPMTTTLTHRQIMVVLSGLMTGTLLASLDQTIVSTALPDHRRRARRHRPPLVGRHRLPAGVDGLDPALREDQRHLRPPAGLHVRDRRLPRRIAALPGRRRTCGSSSAPGRSRGSAAAGCMVLAFVIIGDIIPPHRPRQVPGLLRRRLRRLQSSSARCSAASSSTSSTWRWIFFINIPLGHRGARHHQRASCTSRPSGTTTRSTTSAPACSSSASRACCSPSSVAASSAGAPRSSW